MQVVMFNSLTEAQAVLHGLHQMLIAYAQSVGYTASLGEGIKAKNIVNGEETGAITTEWSEIMPEVNEQWEETGRYYFMSPTPAYGTVLDQMGFTFGSGVDMEYEEPEEIFDDE